MKNRHILLIAVLFFAMSGCANGSNRENKSTNNIKNTERNIVFAVPFAPVSYPIIKMIEDGYFEKQGIPTELIIWNTPDQLKSLIVGKQADFFAVPSNVAAMFYNKGVDVKLLNISIWRAMWLVSRDNDKKTLADFKGETIAMPFKGDMPHLVFMELAKKQGLDPEKDFDLQYVQSPIDAAQKMIMRRVRHAFLIDPAVSMVIQKSKKGLVSVVAPTIYRSVDVQNEWGRLFKTPNEIPFAGIMAGSTVSGNKALVHQFTQAYDEATKWCMKNPEAIAKLVVKHIPELNEAAVAEAMRNVTLRADDAYQSRERIEQFYNVLLSSKPAVIGGKMPDDGFYYQDNDEVDESK